jgi:hypothetical protein
VLNNYAYGPVAGGWSVFRLKRSPSGRLIKRKQLKKFSGEDARKLAARHCNKLELKYAKSRRKESQQDQAVSGSCTNEV